MSSLWHWLPGPLGEAGATLGTGGSREPPVGTRVEDGEHRKRRVLGVQRVGMQRVGPQEGLKNVT